MPVCPYCGEDFEKKVHNQVYCCPTHRRKQESARKRIGVGGAIELKEPGVKELNDNDLVSELSRRGYAVHIETLPQDVHREIKIKRFLQESCIKLGVVSCTHFGSRYQQLTALREFYRVCSHREIPIIANCGDVHEGDGKQHKGQLYEMFIMGWDNQLDYSIENYPREEGITTYLIDGSHDYSFFKTEGASICKALAKERDDIDYLGAFSAYLDIEGISIHMMHGSGGVAYARSYKMQKIIENYAPEQKPNVTLLGHYHVPNYLPSYRNVEGFQLGCMQAQTPYLKSKGLGPIVCGLILEIYPDDKGIASIKNEWLIWHIIRERDY